MWLCPGQGTCGTAHPQGSPKIPSCQPSACQHVQLPSLSAEAALAPPCPGQISTPSFRGFPAKRQNDQLVPCSPPTGVSIWLLLSVGWFYLMIWWSRLSFCPSVAVGQPGTPLPFRRGSNVSLVLDMSSLGNVEPIQPVCTPRDITLKFLRTSSHVLRKQELQQHTQSLAQLQEEFSVR